MPFSLPRPIGLVLSLVAIALSTAQPTAAQTIGNAGFEAPNLSINGGGFRYSVGSVGTSTPTFTPTEAAQTVWNFQGDSGISGNSSGFTSGNPNAPEGLQVGFIQGLGSFSQSVSGFAAGTYAFSFNAAQRVSRGGGGNNGFPTDLQNFQVMVDGTALFGAAGLTPAPTVGGVQGGYHIYTTGPITLSAGTHTLTFQGLDTAYQTAGRTGGTNISDNTAFIDAVSVSPSAPVPEVSTTVSLGLLLALGLGGLVVAGRRRKA